MIDRFIDDNAAAIIERIAASDDWSFNTLVELSELDPGSDFRFIDLRDFDLRGADLRGFDFTGADLRDCLRDATTRIDETTNFNDAKLAWIEGEQIPIVEKMLAIQSASDVRQKTKFLEELVADYSSPDHISHFIAKMIKSTKSPETILLYAEYFPDGRAENYRDLVMAKTRQAILERTKMSKGRKSINRSPRFFLTKFIDQLSSARNPTLHAAYKAYVERCYERGVSTELGRSRDTQNDLDDLLAAFENTRLL